MKAIPVNLRLSGRRALIVGGGHIALRRARLLTDAGAKVTVVAPDPDPGFDALFEKIEIIREKFSAPLMENFFLVICATNDENVNREAALAAKVSGAIVNMAAPPMELSDITIPARVESGDLSLAISTNGKSPELSRALSKILQKRISNVYEPWLSMMENLRSDLKKKIPDAKAREKFWRSAMDDKVLSLIETGKLEEAEEFLKNAAYRCWAES